MRNTKKKGEEKKTKGEKKNREGIRWKSDQKRTKH